MIRLGLVFALMAGSALAQGFGGSFDNGGQQQPAPAPGGNMFGGSFDTGGQQPQPPQGQAPAPGGDSFGGSFGTVVSFVVEAQ